MRAKRRIAALLICFCCLAIPPAIAGEPKLEKLGSTYDLAQVASWLTRDRFAIGRWDGTITVFRPPITGKNEFGPILTQALRSPSSQGIQMMARLGKTGFVTSNDDSSLAVWTENGGEFALKGTANYDPKFGVANSAAVLRAQGKSWLVTGHAQGFLLLWEINGSDITFNKDVSIRSNNPIPSKYPMWNVRSVVRYKDGLVVTGSEDGDICIVEVPACKTLARTRYSPTAQRGINNLSLAGDYLLLANCSVGRGDKNLWLYKLQRDQVTPLDSTNLVKESSRQQVFDFSVALVPLGNDTFFFASTEEGLLWRGQVSGETLTVNGNEKVECEGGATLTYEPENSQLAVTEHTVNLYKVTAK